MSEHTLQLTINGHPREVTVPANRLLLHVLRDDLGMTGTKEGCSVGVCGACSVLVDGQLVSACLLPAVMVDGAAITVENMKARVNSVAKCFGTCERRFPARGPAFRVFRLGFGTRPPTLLSVGNRPQSRPSVRPRSKAWNVRSVSGVESSQPSPKCATSAKTCRTPPRILWRSAKT